MYSLLLPDILCYVHIYFITYVFNISRDIILSFTQFFWVHTLFAFEPLKRKVPKKMHFESIFVRKKNGAENNNKMFTCTSIGNKNQIDRNNIELNT